MTSLCHKGLRCIVPIALALSLSGVGCETTRAHVRIEAAPEANARTADGDGAPVYVLVRAVSADAFAADDYATIEALATQALTGKLPEGVPAPPARVKPGGTTWMHVALPAGQTWGLYVLFTEARDDGSWKRLMSPGKFTRVEIGRAEILE